MIPERWQQIQALFFALVDLPPDARQDRLEALQLQDSLLAEEVQALLLADSQTLPLLDDAIWGRRELDEPLPERLGAYRPIRLLGRGGMGLFYLAERADGAFEQQVALKVVRPDLLERTFIRRFLQERQILAQLNHPGIARLLDGGTLPDGRPFLAMEYVGGIPIDRYCDNHRLSLTARIRLFDQVLEAVIYAHHHLIVHRDLKPSNILVTEQEGKPRVKLLDFGIARLLDAETPALTRTDQRLLTPAYAAPEQLAGRPITTATDVYTLGTVLYQLLTGHLPFEGSLPQLMTQILNREPERASRYGMTMGLWCYWRPWQPAETPRLSDCGASSAATWRPSCAKRCKKTRAAGTPRPKPSGQICNVTSSSSLSWPVAARPATGCTASCNVTDREYC